MTQQQLPGTARRMRALTLWPEWVPAFTHMGKRVENRPWKPPADLTGQRFALHAGAHWPGAWSDRFLRFRECCARAGWLVAQIGGPQHRGRGDLCRTDGGDAADFAVPLGCVFATVRLSLVTEYETGIIHQAATSADVETAPACWVGTWAIGPFCWWLSDLRLLDEPIPARGRQRLWWWEVPSGVQL